MTTERPALDAWLADTEWVTSNDPLSVDAVRCRPDDGEPPTPANALTTLLVALSPLSQAMQQLAEQFEEVMRGIAAAMINASSGLLKMAEQWEQDRVAQEQEQQRVRDELEHPYPRFAPPAPLKIRGLANLPLRADSCPRHGPTRGGTCWRCRR